MPPIHPQKLPALLNEARRLQAAGQLDAARQRLETILLAKPDLPEGHYQLARVLIDLGELEQSLAHLDRAANLRPTEPAIWLAYAAALQRVADPARITAFLAKAKTARVDARLLLTLQDRLRPKTARSRPQIGAAPPAEIQRAISLLQGGHTAQAAALAGRLRKAHPKVALIADLLASALAEQGKSAQAEQHFRAAIRLDPTYAEAHAHFGHFLLRQNRNDEAVSVLMTGLRLVPDMPLALADLGAALARTGRNARAIEALQRALALNPGLVDARLTLARTLLSESRASEVESVLAPLAGKQVFNSEVKVILARSLAALGQDKAAEAAFDAAIESDPGAVQPLGAKAMFLQQRGRFEEAETLFRKTIEIDPANGEQYQIFLVSKRLPPGDPLIAQMQRYFDDPATTGESRMYFGFALAKIMEDLKEYPKVFNYLRPANDLARRFHPYDVETRRKTIADIKAQFRDADFNARRIAGTTDFAPIFVTGLPRSGTTLVEQIIASHSSVAAGGELGWALSEATDVLGTPRRPLVDVSDADIARIGHRTAERMRRIDPAAGHVTDKSVQSYTMIGPLRLAMPRARIIVVRRDPRDNLLSIYKNRFDTGTHLYSNSLTDLAIYFRLFEEIMEFWQDKTPDWFYQIEYEALIADPETEARKLTAACGLAWEDQCLAFHKNTSRVNTLSVHQVRQPLYASSMQAWRRYEADLGELLEALGGEYAPGAEKG